MVCQTTKRIQVSDGSATINPTLPITETRGITGTNGVWKGGLMSLRGWRTMTTQQPMTQTRQQMIMMMAHQLPQRPWVQPYSTSEHSAAQKITNTSRLTMTILLVRTVGLHFNTNVHLHRIVTRRVRVESMIYDDDTSTRMAAVARKSFKSLEKVSIFSGPGVVKNSCKRLRAWLSFWHDV